MEKRAGRTGFAAVTILLVLVTAFFVSETVSSRTKTDVWETQDYMARARELTQEVGRQLAQEGFQNSGVMVTRVTEEDGSCVVTIWVHHRDIQRMGDAQKAALCDRIEGIPSPVEGYCFCARFH